MKRTKWGWNIFTCIGLISTGGLLVWFILSFAGFSFSEPEKDKIYEKEFRKNYAIYAVHIPEKLDFAGEDVPVYHYDVYESIDREFLVNVYWQSQTMLFIKRANKYFPVIEPILENNGIPDDFKYLALTESGLQNVVSPAGATGYWQFLKGTGKEYGLEISDEVDERYDLGKSTLAACKYFKEAYAKYKNWTMVAASYNMGMGGADKQIEKQKVKDYHDLLLNNETARYVYRIIAIKTILSNPADYGFHYRDKDLYQPVPTFDVEIDSAITDFVDFAKGYNINYKILKEFNPWLRQSYLTNKDKKKYIIKIPVEGFRSFQKAYEYNRPDSVTTDTVQ